MSLLPTQEEFAEELRQGIVDFLRTAGFTVPSGANVRRTCIDLFKVLHRMIPTQPRSVRWSSELRAKMLPERQRVALQTIESESLGGLNLNNRLTRYFWNADFDDQMLNDWGIQHLHLGPPGAARRGMAGGTKEVLFALVRPDVVYFIDVLPHILPRYSAFEEQGLMEIVHSNWPDVLERYRIGAYLRFGRGQKPLTPQERREARKGGLITVTQMADGTNYWPPGGGQASSGDNIHAVERATEFYHTAARFHAWCAEHLQYLAECFVAETSTQPIRFRLHLEFRAGHPCLFLKETHSGRIMDLIPVETPQSSST